MRDDRCGARALRRQVGAVLDRPHPYRATLAHSAWPAVARIDAEPGDPAQRNRGVLLRLGVVALLAMGRDKGKIPPDKNAPSPGKNARTSVDDPQRSQDKPTWRVRRIALDGPFGWDCATAEDTRFVRKKLGEFETMRWFELPEKQHHYLSWDSLSKDARDEFDRQFREEERETLSRSGFRTSRA
jgi:hypothetical protein